MMNIKKTGTALLAFVATIAYAQGQPQNKDNTPYIFNPHWTMQIQAGAAQTIGETGFTDLISPAAAFNVGYQFTPALGIRVGASGWQAKGSWVSPKQDYSYKYLQGNVDLVSDLSTLFCGFNPTRVFNGYAFAGVGLNHAFDNDEANALDTKTYALEYLWQDSQNLVAGRFGLGCDLRLNDRLSINIEGNANVLSDKFNSKKAGNCDWQFNALVGLSITLGKGYTKPTPVYIDPVPVAVERPQPQPAPVVVDTPQAAEEVAAQSMQQDIFFALNSARIQDGQQTKIKLLVEYLRKNPSAKVTVTGYADENTGNSGINKILSEKRAVNVSDALKSKGVSAERIIMDYKGDTVQPYNTPEKNRVSICIAQ